MLCFLMFFGIFVFLCVGVLVFLVVVVVSGLLIVGVELMVVEFVDGFFDVVFCVEFG